MNKKISKDNRETTPDKFQTRYNIIRRIHKDTSFHVYQKQVPVLNMRARSLYASRIPIKIQISSRIRDRLRKKLVPSQFRGVKLSFSIDKRRGEK